MIISVDNIPLSGSGVESPSNVRFSTTIAHQISSPIRAEFVRLLGRKTKMFQLSFSVSRIHDSPLAAASFIVDHGLALPSGDWNRSSNIKISLSSFTGNVSNRTHHGLLVSADGDHIGASSLFSYNLLLGERIES